MNEEESLKAKALRWFMSLPTYKRDRIWKDFFKQKKNISIAEYLLKKFTKNIKSI